MQINYDELLTNYKKNLESNLRGFSGGPPPFETWAPTEGNHYRSILDLIDIAIAEGHGVVHVSAPSEIMDDATWGEYKDGVITIDRGVTYKSNLAFDLEQEINEIAKKYGFMNKVTVEESKPYLLTLDYDEAVGSPLSQYLIQIEDHLALRLGSRIYLQTMNLDDKNKRKIGRCAER